MKNFRAVRSRAHICEVTCTFNNRISFDVANRNVIDDRLNENPYPYKATRLNQIQRILWLWNVFDTKSNVLKLHCLKVLAIRHFHTYEAAHGFNLQFSRTNMRPIFTLI